MSEYWYKPALLPDWPGPHPTGIHNRTQQPLLQAGSLSLSVFLKAAPRQQPAACGRILQAAAGGVKVFIMTKGGGAEVG